MGCKRVTRPFCIERALRFEGKENKASKTHGSKLLILLRGKVFRSDVLMNLGYFMQQHRVNVVANMCQLNASACSLLNLRSPDCRLRFWKNNPMTTWSVIRTHWIFQRKEGSRFWLNAHRIQCVQHALRCTNYLQHFWQDTPKSLKSHRTHKPGWF